MSRALGRMSAEAAQQRTASEEDFRSYYGRPVIKEPVWEWHVPAYLFAGGLSAACAELAAGADLTRRPRLRKATRLGALGGLGASMYFLIADLGRPERFHHMLRVAKPSSPMSVGTWLLVAYGPGVGVAALAELLPAGIRRSWPGKLIGALARPAGMASAAIAPGVASYTAVLLSHTAVPAWNEARDRLPFVFTGSAAAAGGGFGMVCAPVEEAEPARKLAAVGAVTELITSRQLEERLDIVSEAYRKGKAHRLGRWSEYLTAGGALGSLVAGRSRGAAVISGIALLAGSALQRFRIFEAGVESARDPKYVVVPQRRRVDRGEQA